MKRFVSVLAATSAFAACTSDDPRGWLVDRTRVIGARVEVVAEPRRASLAPGESARMLWLVANPDDGKPAPRLAWAFAACVPPAGTQASLRCDGATLAAQTGEGDSSAPIVMPFVTPAREATGDAPELLVLAAFCRGGAPTLDARAFTATCANGDPALLASVFVRLAAAGPNANPEIAEGSISFDGVVLANAPQGFPGAPCDATADTPRVAAGSGDHTFTFRFTGDEREPTPSDRAPLETLLVSHLVTTGELERQWSYLDPGDAAPKDVFVKWTAPGADTTPDAGRLVEIHFVLRDGRGGASFARRTLCLRKP
mgnify:CR=1 FL=1